LVKLDVVVVAIEVGVMIVTMARLSVVVVAVVLVADYISFSTLFTVYSFAI